MLRSFAVYTGLRLVFLLGAFGVFLILGFPTPLAILFGLLVSAVASLLLLRGPREKFTEALIARRTGKADEQQRLRQLLDEDAA